MQQIKSTSLHFNTPPTVLCFRLSFWWKRRICTDWGLQDWNLSELNKNSSFWIFRTAKILMQNTQSDKSPIKKVAGADMFSMLTLMEKTRRVVLVRTEFEEREKLNLKSFFGIFGLSGFGSKWEEQWFFKWILVYKWCVLDWVLDGGSRTCSDWNLKVWISGEIKINSTFWNVWTASNPTHGSKHKTW